MRLRETNDNNGLSVYAIAGTYVVLMGFNAPAAAAQGLLGFAIHRTDHTENEAYWLSGFRTFEAVEPDPPRDMLIETVKHPIQGFLWGDYTAKPDHQYTYKVVPMYGVPAQLQQGPPVSVTVTTESVENGEHAVFFNRGVAASQAYAREFQNRPPEEVPNRRAFTWLSRGLEEALLAFIAQANSPRYSLRAAVYEFTYEPVLKAFGQAATDGADVKIIFDARESGEDNKRRVAKANAAIDACAIRTLVIPRRTNPSYIAHNKFIVLLVDGQPQQVWTGSTNLTEGGIFGHSNVGHVVRNAPVAQAFLDYWERLRPDPQAGPLRQQNVQATPDPNGPASANGIAALFSPRPSLAALEWYGQRMDAAAHAVCLTAAFGVTQILAEVLKLDEPFLRYILLETPGQTFDLFSRDPDNRIAIGSIIQDDALYRWTAERLTGFNSHVRFVHTKYMLIDPLTDHPTVISGSANFSVASTRDNDENMLVIQDNTRVADIYLGEFMRLFNHFQFREFADRLRSAPESERRKSAFLDPTDQWAAKYYAPGSVREKERLLFA